MMLCKEHKHKSKNESVISKCLNTVTRNNLDWSNTVACTEFEAICCQTYAMLLYIKCMVNMDTVYHSGVMFHVDRKHKV